MKVAGTAVSSLIILLHLGQAYANEKKFSDELICKAAIAAIMGKDPSIVSSKKKRGGNIILRYIRPTDKSKWSYRCKVLNKKIIWGTIDGRWRDHPNDPVVTYSERENTLSIIEKYVDGSSNDRLYSKDELK